jgi:hypothetical protein
LALSANVGKFLTLFFVTSYSLKKFAPCF